jgi:hypothetical protein
MKNEHLQNQIDKLKGEAIAQTLMHNALLSALAEHNEPGFRSVVAAIQSADEYLRPKLSPELQHGYGLEIDGALLFASDELMTSSEAD